MAECVICGDETERYINEKPICLECEQDSPIPHLPQRTHRTQQKPTLPNDMKNLPPVCKCPTRHAAPKRCGLARMSIEAPGSQERSLLAEYVTATSFYSWAVNELSRQRGVVPPDGYNKLFELVEEARIGCDQARVALRDFRNGKRKAQAEI